MGSDPGSSHHDSHEAVDHSTASLFFSDRFSSADSAVQPSSLRQLSPLALAYLGDAVYELYIRTHYLLPPKRIQAYHDLVVSQVRAEQQAERLRLLLSHLTPEEQDILRRGRNASPRGPKRLDPAVYQQATSLETLLGHLFITNPARLKQLLQLLVPESDRPCAG